MKKGGIAQQSTRAVLKEIEPFSQKETRSTQSHVTAFVPGVF